MIHMDHFTLSNADLILRLLVAMLFGSLIGIERTIAGKTAGVRTYALVSMGSALFVLVSIVIASWYNTGNTIVVDPLRMASQIIVGIGFLGAGLIILKESHISGLTTAAGLWVSAGIGMAAGFGLFLLALMATIITIVIFTVMWFVEERYVEGGKIKNLYGRLSQHEKSEDH
jgi:putative Mg2+ transporter-C (MgtC) family protein